MTRGGLSRLWFGAALALALAGCDHPSSTRAPSDESETLASWTDGGSRAAIEQFVAEVVDPQSEHFVPDEQRIAVFDNDGTLWVEQPVYAQLAFALDRVSELGSEHPEWSNEAPMSYVIANDHAALANLTPAEILELVAVSHAGTTTEDFEALVAAWLAQARHPQLDKPYTELTYQPMVELLAYLREHGFKTYIVTGGGVDFVRVVSESAYGVVPEQVIGSSLVTEYRSESKSVVRQAELFFFDDGPAKVAAIERHIGRRPIIAVGNSDGDFEMLEWTTAGPGRRLGILVHHTDEAREFAYDRNTHVGHLDRGLTAARERGWVVVDMQDDWQVVFDAE